jgi:hypothetical protein
MMSFRRGDDTMVRICIYSLLQVVELLRRLPSPARLQLQRAALYLADDVPGAEAILFEAALDDVTVDIQQNPARELQMLSMQVCAAAAQRHLSCCR